jgi:hypothetical protein
MIDFYDVFENEIRRAAPIALDFLELNWRVADVWLTHQFKWQVDFYDENNQWHYVSFERPPHADEDWYTQEIIRQLQEQLTITTSN